MKKSLVFIITCFIAICVNAQESNTDYIYSADGFEIKKVTHLYLDYDDSEITSQQGYSTGLYSRDGRINAAYSYHQQ